MALKFPFSLLAVLLMSACTPTMAEDVDYRAALVSVGRGIEALKADFPQLVDFSVERNVNADALTISYAYRTHGAPKTGGWTSGVPNPDDDGIWFLIDFHDPDSTAEIHTQPLTASVCLRNRRVSYLSLDGAKTRSADAVIWHLLRAQGVSECARQDSSR